MRQDEMNNTGGGLVLFPRFLSPICRNFECAKP